MTGEVIMYWRSYKQDLSPLVIDQSLIELGQLA